ncbi:MAG: D-glycero-alpha-D-manno-heptose-1,7-bisphosphate 7-phosphatase [Planctomycetota bacterium]|jgi:D-glycero-D-manno-heptose 1,7-bisphosphate phosphatase
MMAHKAVFLDRDDTIVDDPGYIRSPEQLRLIPGAAEALKQLKKMGYLLVVITNQSGVARGFVTEEQLEEIHQELRRQLAADNAMIDRLYYCPYHPDGEVKDFSVESNLRKPNAGMFFQAEEDLDIDLTQSWMIGDSYRDIQAGKVAGCHTILVDVPGKIREKKKTDAEPDRKAVNLREAVNIIRMYEFHQKAKSVKQTPEQSQGSDDSSESSDPEPANQTLSDKPEAKDSIHPPHTELEAVVEEVAPLAAPETKTETEAASEEESQATAPESAKVYTAKNRAEAPQPAEPISETHHLLEEIALRLKRKDREGLYQEFSVFKLLSLMLQVIAVFCLIISLCFWLSPKIEGEPVMIMIGYSIALQLIVIALLMMHSRD